MTLPLDSWNSHVASCVHEAGHAVVGHLLGAQIASIVVNQDGSGETKIGPVEPRVSIHIRVAGYLAELRYCDLVPGCPAERHPSLSNSDDMERAWASALEACPDDLVAASKLLADAKRTIRVTIAEKWDRIERVAAVLADSPEGILRASVFVALLAKPCPR